MGWGLREPAERANHGGGAVGENKEVNTIELPSAEAPKTPEQLGDFVSKTRSALAQLSSTAGVNAEATKKASVDLEAALTSAKEALKAAQKAEEIAKNAARMELDPRGLKLDAVRGLVLRKPDHDFAKYGMGTNLYSLLTFSKSEMNLLDEPAQKAVQRFRLLHDTLAITDAYYRGHGTASANAQAYFERGGMKGLRLWKQYEDAAHQLDAAMSDTGTGGGTTNPSWGADWAPRGVGLSLIEDIRPELELVSFIETIPMPRNPYLYPVQGIHFLASLAAESTADTGNTALAKNNLQTWKLNLDAVKLAAMLMTSTELEEDSIVPLIAAIRNDLAFSIAAALEHAVLNGQLTSTIDTADVPGATDPRKAWDGLRSFANQVGVSFDFGTGVIVEGLNSIKGQLGKFGKRPGEGVWTTSYAGWAKLLALKDSSGTSLVLTQEKFGSAATVSTGVLGMLLGSPIVVADLYPQAMGATGYNDGSGVDRTGLLYWNHRTVKLGEVRLSLIESSRDWAFDQDQIAFRVTYRAAFKPVRTPALGTWAVAGMGRNIASN